MYEDQVKYLAVCVWNGIQFSKENQTPSAKLKFMTIKNITEDTPCTKTLYADLWLTEAAADRSLEVLSDVFGFDGEDLSVINDDENLFSGTNVILVTGFEDYNGNTVEKVKFINHPAKGGFKKADPAAVSDLSAQLRGKLRNYYNNNKPESAPVKTKVPPAKNMAPLKNNNQAPVAAPAQADPLADDLPF